jgi:hypothetical protein
MLNENLWLLCRIWVFEETGHVLVPVPLFSVMKSHSVLKRVLSGLIGLVEFGHTADGTIVQFIFSPNVWEADCSAGSKFETLVVQLTEMLMPKDAELVTGQVMHNMGWCWLY